MTDLAFWLPFLAVTVFAVLERRSRRSAESRAALWEGRAKRTLKALRPWTTPTQRLEWWDTIDGMNEQGGLERAARRVLSDDLETDSRKA